MDTRERAIGGRRLLGGEAGLSIVEVLVAAFIVGIAGVGVALMFGTGQAYIQAEGDNRVATFLAQQKIEQLRAQGYTGLAVTDATTTVPPATATETVDLTVASNIPTQYSRTWSIVCVSRDDYSVREACATTSAKKISMTVQTSPVDPKATAVTLESALSSR